MLNIAICDDDLDYIKSVENSIIDYVSNHPVQYNIFKFTKSSDIINSSQAFDIAFLDIEIDEKNGIEIGKILKQKNKDIILMFLTAYSGYLDEAMDLNILRFFEKPLNKERFDDGFKKALEIIDDTEVAFYLKDNSEMIKISSNDIVYVEIEHRKTRVITKNDSFHSSNNIKYWREQLNKTYFNSPHNSYIINMNYITKYKRDTLVLQEKYTIPIAYKKQVDFRQSFLKYMEKR